MTCEFCNKRDKCTKICKDVEKILKGDYSESYARRKESPFSPQWIDKIYPKLLWRWLKHPPKERVIDDGD